MINLRIITLIFSFLISYLGYTQVKISGKLTTESGENITNAVITINSTSNQVLTYVNSNEKGNFSISFIQSNDSLLLKVKTLKYKPITIKIANKTAHFNFILEEEAFELEELIIEAPPIKKRGDTLSYHVDSFARDYDRTISDVIKRMPGIEVDINGRILYQGKPINKYYIEGLDMLQGRYNLVNENLPFKEVLDVQIIENHQPIRLLDSLSYSDNAALNIKLKNKQILTGQVKVGSGYSPLLWDANVTPMYLSKTNQALFTYQSSNMGYDISNQLEVLSQSEINQENESVARSSLLSLINPTTPGISKKYWLDNNTHLLNFNAIKKLNNNYELKLYSSYVNDYQKLYGENYTQIFTNKDTLSLNQNIDNKISSNAFILGTEILRNSTSDYLLNRTEFKLNSNNEIGKINANNEFIENSLAKKYWSITNRFHKYIFVAKQLIDFNSLISYGVNNLELQVSPDQFDEILNEGNSYNYVTQNVDSKDINTKNSLGFTKGLGKFTLNQKIGFDFEQKIFNSNISIDGEKKLDSDFKNDVRWIYNRIFADLGIQYKYKNWKAGVSFPLNYRLYDIKKNNSDEKDISFNKLNLEPSFYLIRDLNKFWQASASTGIGKYYGNFNQIPNGYILRNYNTLLQNNSLFPETLTKNVSVGIKYRNPLIATFTNASYTYSRNETNITQSTTIDSDINTENSFIERKNNSDMHTVSANISKYFRYIKTKISLNTSYTIENSQLYINKYLSKTKANNKSISLNIDYRLNDDVSIVYQSNLSNYKNTLDINNSFKSKQFNNEITVTWQFAEKHYLQFNALNTTIKILNNKNNHFLSNILYRYKIKKYNIDLDVQVFNLFNAKEFTTNIIDSYSYQSNIYRLRQRQMLITLRFSL